MTAMSSPTCLKTACIGGGSREKLRKLMIDPARSPDLAGDLPKALAASINQPGMNQALIIDDRLLNNSELAFQVLLNQPFNHLPIDSSREPFKEFLQINRGFMAIPGTANNRVKNGHTQIK
jgi:hypothetical protein